MKTKSKSSIAEIWAEGREDFSVPTVLSAFLLAILLLLGFGTLAVWGLLNLAGVAIGFYHAMGLLVTGYAVLALIGGALGLRHK